MKNNIYFRSACIILILLGATLMWLEKYDIAARILFILGVVGGIFAAVNYNSDKSNNTSAFKKNGKGEFLIKLSSIIVGSFVVVYFATKFFIN